MGFLDLNLIGLERKAKKPLCPAFAKVTAPAVPVDLQGVFAVDQWDKMTSRDSQPPNIRRVLTSTLSRSISRAQVRRNTWAGSWSRPARFTASRRAAVDRLGFRHRQVGQHPIPENGLELTAERHEASLSPEVENRRFRLWKRITARLSSHRKRVGNKNSDRTQKDPVFPRTPGLSYSS